MSENLEASDSPVPARPGAPLTRRWLWRRVVYPLLVIAAIAGVIWWLGYRDSGGGVSSSGELYGPTALPAELAPPGVSVDPEVGALAPDFLLERLDSGEIRLSELRGRPVVLNFWATWCSPCRKEMPQLIKAYDSLQDQGLVVIGLNLQEGKSIVRPFADDFGIKFPIAIDHDGEVGDRYRLLGLPTTFFIDRNGVVRSVFTGPFLGEGQGTKVQGAIEENELQKRIDEIMAIPAAVPAAASPAGQ